VIEVLGHQHLSQQAGGGEALVDDVWRHRGLDEPSLSTLMAAGADPLAAHVALDAEDTGLVVELLGHVLADALHGLAAAAGGVVGFVVNLPARQVRGQLLALGLLLFFGRGLGRLVNFDLGSDCSQVGIQRLFDQAFLLGAVGLGLRSELQPLEHGHLVCELVDGGLLEGNLARLPDDELLRAAQGLAQLLRRQGVDEFVGDHEA
jgi:hypothetical protein